MTPMSIVVADLGGCPQDADACAAAIERELQFSDEVIWAGAGAPPARLPSTRCASSPRSARGELYAVGLRAARHPHVAFTDSRTVLAAGWRRVAGHALGDHVVVGGPVLPGEARTLRSWAGFFVEYGPHAAPPYSSWIGDVAANNVAYQRHALVDVVPPGASFWKTQVHERLRARGIEPVVVDAMAVTSIKRYRWKDLTTSRMAHGRLFGAQRAAAMPATGRVIAALRCGVLPPVAYARLARGVATDGRLRGRFLLSTPLLAVALVAWSIGEAFGYATAREARRDVD